MDSAWHIVKISISVKSGNNPMHFYIVCNNDNTAKINNTRK